MIQNSGVFIEVDGKPDNFGAIRTDASFPEMFDLPKSLQSFVFLPPYSAENERINPTVLETAITRKAARKLFGTEDVVGIEIKTLNKQTLSIRFVVNEWSDNTDIPFDFIYKTSDPFLPRMGSATTTLNAWEGQTDDKPLFHGRLILQATA